MRPSIRYPSLLATAAVAGIFTLVVGVLLSLDFMSRGQFELFDAPQYLELKAQLAERGKDPALSEQVRALDQQLREAYFHHRHFMQFGVLLFLGGLAVTLTAARAAAASRPLQPHPTPLVGTVDHEAVQQHWGRWAVAGLAVILSSTLAVIAWRTPDVLSVTADSPTAMHVGHVTAAATPTEGPTAKPPLATPPTPAAGTAVPVPDYAEYRQQWPRFRGPTGSGISSSTNAPEAWDAESGAGVVWKTAVPLAGFGSPVVWKDRVFLSGASDTEQAVFCFDAESGQALWQVDVPPISTRPEEFEINEETGYAAPTVATDGVRVYAIFASGDLVAVDFEGHTVWQKGLGVPKNPYGHASSLATWQDRLIVQMDQGTAKDDLSKLMAFDGSTGAAVWEVVRPVPSSWSTPIVVEHEGKPIVITTANPWVIAYAAADGSELWRAKCLAADVGPSPVYDNGQVFAANESGGLSVIRAGGSGDVTDSHILWQTDISIPDVCSPLVTDKFVLLLTHGVLACFDRQGGEEPLWEEDVEEEASASPAMAGNRIYLITVDGKGRIVEATADACRQIAECNLGEPCYTSPAFHAERLYVRGEKHLFCLGRK